MQRACTVMGLTALIGLAACAGSPRQVSRAAPAAPTTAASQPAGHDGDAVLNLDGDTFALSVSAETKVPRPTADAAARLAGYYEVFPGNDLYLFESGDFKESLQGCYAGESEVQGRWYEWDRCVVLVFAGGKFKFKIEYGSWGVPRLEYQPEPSGFQLSDGPRADDGEVLMR